MDYRCDETIDVEGEYTHVRGIATYQSGRKEEFDCKLRVDGTPPLAFQKKLKDLSAYPKINSVKTERFFG